jgi:phosphatidylethanolamine/phosphatidyl-N-methylethanolamine N-methyltransferase
MSDRLGPLAGVRDVFRYIATWRTTGAVAPSGPALARRMVRHVDPAAELPVLELGPGNGVVTHALLERGVRPERIVAVEYNPEFCDMLRARYPGVRVVEGDAFDLTTTLVGVHDGPFANAVSSLPLLLWPPAERRALVLDVLSRLAPGGALAQFSYAPRPPVPVADDFTLSGSAYIVLNLPPARVWTYRSL